MMPDHRGGKLAGPEFVDVVDGHPNLLFARVARWSRRDLGHGGQPARIAGGHGWNGITRTIGKSCSFQQSSAAVMTKDATRVGQSVVHPSNPRRGAGGFGSWHALPPDGELSELLAHFADDGSQGAVARGVVQRVAVGQIGFHSSEHGGFHHLIDSAEKLGIGDGGGQLVEKRDQGLIHVQIHIHTRETEFQHTGADGIGVFGVQPDVAGEQFFGFPVSHPADAACHGAHGFPNGPVEPAL